MPNKKNGNIEILVDDSGPGIPKNQREDVFKPFYRLDNSRSPDRGGTGLGLTIARDSVRAHGGDLVLESSPSGGTRAKLTPSHLKRSLIKVKESFIWL